ncbi:MAG TPA: hypothetical protein VK524_34770, partial [Polyangiaceae bacterium]|nr:hypothetical protein [Polyangiaceae bacterium]
MTTRLRFERRGFRSAWPSAALLLLLLASCQPRSVLVTTTADGGPGSLRAAIDAANAAGATATRIALPTGTYDLTRCGADDTNAAGDLDITTDAKVSLVATGPNAVIRQTCANERLLHVLGQGLFTLAGVTLTGGRTDGSGGALLTTADAEITRSNIHHNSATLTGGGLSIGGRLTISETSVTENSVSHTLFFPGSSPSQLQAPVSGGGIEAKSVEGDTITVANNSLNGCTT